MPTTIFRFGEKIDFFLLFTCLMNPLIIISAALKSAITPSRRGRIVFTPGLVCSCISFAGRPIAMHRCVLLSMATMLGSSSTMRSFWKMTVLAVPRSIAISCVKNEKAILKLRFFVYIYQIANIRKNV